MLMESQVKFCSPQYISGASQCWKVWKHKKATKEQKKHEMPQLVWYRLCLWKPQDPKLIWKDIIYSLNSGWGAS